MTTLYLFIMMAAEFSPSRAIVVAAHKGQAAGLRKVINDGIWFRNLRCHG